MVQKQWLNLYLFDEDNLSFYKLLYYFSGLLCPILVCFNSINKFTNYRFNNQIKNARDISGRRLLLTILIVLIPLATLLSNYIYINLKLLFKIFISDNNYLLSFENDKQILLIAIISILLIIKKTRLFTKIILLINFLMISIFIWYAHINNILFDDVILVNKILKFENINFINILFLLKFEILYYLWVYISYSSNLSDWSVVVPKAKELFPILKITIFHFLIIIYYSILY